MIRKLQKLTEGVLFGEGKAGMKRQLKVAHMERENYSKRFFSWFFGLCFFFPHLGQASKTSFCLFTDLRNLLRNLSKIQKFWGKEVFFLDAQKQGNTGKSSRGKGKNM